MPNKQRNKIKMSKSCTGFFNKITSDKPLNIFIDKCKDKASAKNIRNKKSDFFITKPEEPIIEESHQVTKREEEFNYN